MRLIFTNADSLHITPERAERRARIAELMRSTAKASEADLPPEQRRQILDAEHTVSAIAAGETIQRTAGPTWEQRMRIVAVLAIGLPAMPILAYIVARCLGYVADAAGAAFFS